MNLNYGEGLLTQSFFNQKWLDFYGITEVGIGIEHEGGFAALKFVGVTDWKKWYYYILSNFDCIWQSYEDLSSILVLFDKDGFEVKCKKYHFREEYTQEYMVHRTEYFIFDINV